MSKTIRVHIVSAESEIWEGEAEMVFASAEQGGMGIAPRHAPLLTRLEPGEVRVRKPGGEEMDFYVSGGILEIQPHLVSILADTAERAADLDEAAAIEAKRRAEEAIANRKGDVDISRAQAQLAEAAARLKLVQKLKKKKS
ncbi:F0F1 ATP synthase subunit epsilon [Natronospira sp.]|uniref:F0F1 ATP synthase subunit epsilon n=1 Tax=Natronospira sp. TaxID=2024970 RepID=UPI003872EFBB